MRQHWSVARDDYRMMISFCWRKKKAHLFYSHSLSLFIMHVAFKVKRKSRILRKKITSWEFSFVGSWKWNDQPLIRNLTRSCPSKCSHWEPLAHYIQMRSRQPLSLSLYIWRPFSAGLLERFVIALFQFFFVSLPLSLSLTLNSSLFLAHSDIHYSSL